MESGLQEEVQQRKKLELAQVVRAIAQELEEQKVTS
jgi:hypothetical protein